MARPKGSKNVIELDIKNMIRAALKAKGGSSYFEWLADEHPASFVTLLAKILPTEISGDINNKHTILLKFHGEPEPITIDYNPAASLPRVVDTETV